MKTIDSGEILSAARAAGFDDARIVPYTDDGCKTKDGAPFKTKSILVLFSRYAARGGAGAGCIGVSAYYAASNRAYLAAGLLAERLSAEGIPALRDSALPARRIARMTGGCIGKNGFYYHPAFGSLVHIQTIRLGVSAEAEAEAAGEKCRDCGACARACPTGAITAAGVDAARCLRSHMDGVIPDDMKPFVYQLLGCEKCQSACPMNGAEGETLPDYGLAETIRGETMGALKELVGRNMARLLRITNQAITVAANRKDTAVRPAVSALAGDERFADACRYYFIRTRRDSAEND